jgi:hypothetical protein
VDVEGAVQAHALEQSQRAGDIAGEADLNSEPLRASARVEQHGQSAVVDEGNLAEVDDHVLRPAGERALNRAAEFRRVSAVQVAAHRKNGAPTDGALRDLEGAILAPGPARRHPSFEIRFQRNLRATVVSVLRSSNVSWSGSGPDRDS